MLGPTDGREFLGPLQIGISPRSRMKTRLGFSAKTLSTLRRSTFMPGQCRSALANRGRRCMGRPRLDPHAGQPAPRSMSRLRLRLHGNHLVVTIAPATIHSKLCPQSSVRVRRVMKFISKKSPPILGVDLRIVLYTCLHALFARRVGQNCARIDALESLGTFSLRANACKRIVSASRTNRSDILNRECGDWIPDETAQAPMICFDRQTAPRVSRTAREGRHDEVSMQASHPVPLWEPRSCASWGAPGRAAIRRCRRGSEAEDVRGCFRNIPGASRNFRGRFMGTMGFFAASLSMNCTDCHVTESAATRIALPTTLR